MLTETAKSRKFAQLGLTVTSMVYALFLMGCMTPIHQQKAAESFARSFVTLADFYQHEAPLLLEGVIALAATSVALRPDVSLQNDQITKNVEKFRTGRLALSKEYRILATVPKSILEDDREEILKKRKKYIQLLKEAAPHMDRPIESLPHDLTSAEEASFRTESKEVVVKTSAEALVAQMDPSIARLRDTLLDAIKSNNVLASEVKIRAANIIEDTEQPLQARLAAVDKYNAASRIPYEMETLSERLETVFTGALTINNEMAKALQDPRYTWDDLQSFVGKAEEFLAQIEKATAIIKRIGALIVFL